MVSPLGKLIELPVRTSEILPILPAWAGKMAIRTTLQPIFCTSAFHQLHDFAFLNIHEHLFPSHDEYKSDFTAGFSELMDSIFASLVWARSLSHLKMKNPINEPSIPPDIAIPAVASKTNELDARAFEGELGIVDKIGDIVVAVAVEE